MHLAKVELGEISCRTTCRTGSTTDTTLQLGHLEKYLITLAQVVMVDVYNSRAAYCKAPIYRSHTHLTQIFGYSIGHSRALIQHLADTLGSGDGTGIEYPLAR